VKQPGAYGNHGQRAVPPEEAAGGKARLLFLPPYSPDYNPVEKSRADMKRFPRNNPRDFQPASPAVCDYFGVP
jgi:transposase